MRQLAAHRRHKTDEESPWLSVSDLMAGLMVLFLFVAIIYIRPLVQTQSKIEEIVETWEDSRERLYLALQREFQYDLRVWDAEMEKETLTIRFRAPDILFQTGKSELSPYFKRVLDAFFSRYVAVLSEFQTDLEEVRIEGHTSSEWSADTPEVESYFKNMELSQARTRSVLQYAFSLDNYYEKSTWIKNIMTANGLSFSKPILNKDGSVNNASSRRVEFRVRTNTEKKIQEVIESLK